MVSGTGSDWHWGIPEEIANGRVESAYYLDLIHCFILSAINAKNVFFFFLAFLPFLGPLPRQVEVPRLGVKSEL